MTGTQPHGTEPGRETRGGAPEPVADILRRVLRGVGPAEHRRRSDIADAWARVAGPGLADEARAVTLQRGVLTVEVRSAALLAELRDFRTEELLARLLEQDRTGRVRGLRFRPGVF